MGRIKLGHEKNPLILENESIDRVLINKNIPKIELNFSDIEARGFDHFLFNLSGNPFISKSALRIGTFLYAYFMTPQAKTKGSNWKIGEAFYISDKHNNADNHYDEEYFHCSYRGKKHHYPRPLKGLTATLTSFGIEISSSNLLKALNELHDFHYITVSPRPVREVGNKKLYTRTCFRHLRIYKGMMDKPFYAYLKNKEVKTRNILKSDS